MYRGVGLHRTLFTGFILLMFIGIQSCDNPAQSSDATNGTDEFSTIEGRVIGERQSQAQGLARPQAGVEGAAVIVTRADADGSLENVSRDTVYTDANGRYRVQTNMENTSNLVIVARKNGHTWKANVSGEVEHNSTVYAVPAGEESTVETELFTGIRLRKNANTVTFADVQTRVSEELAGEIEEDNQARNQVSSAITAEIQTQIKVMREDFNLSEAEVQAFTEAQVRAQNQLAASLLVSGTNDSEIRAAYNEFTESYLKAYGEAGIDIQTYAETSQIAGTAGLRLLVTASDSVRFKMMAQTASLRAYIIDYAVQSHFGTISASDSVMNEVIEAGVTLRDEIESAGTAEAIISAYSNYRTTVMDLLQVTLADHAEILGQLHTSVNASHGIKATLQSTLTTAFSNDAVIQAYMNFFDSVGNEVETVMQSASETEIAATAQVLILLNMAG